MEIRKQVGATVAVVAAMLTAVACNSKSDVETDYTYNDDTAVTAFVLGTVNQNVHTIGSLGQDSVYVENITGSSYKFYIDHQQKLIWNPDSLPYGCDATSMTATISTKNSGQVWLLDKGTTDSYSLYSASEAIDFSDNRTLRVLSQSGLSYRDYTVKVGVRKVKEGTLEWQKCPDTSLFASATDIKGVDLDGNIYIFATDGTKTKMYVADGATGDNWTTGAEDFAADAWDNVAATDDALYLLDGTALKELSNGTWQTISAAADLSHLIGAVGATLYALDGSGALVASADGGATWQPEALDDDIALLPTSRVSIVAKALDTDGSTQRLLMAGYRDDATPALVWTRLTATGFAQLETTWMYADLAGDTRYALPNWQQLAVVVANGNFVAMGLSAQGELASVLVSKDQGITWKQYDGYGYPEQLATSPNVFTAFAGKDGLLWIVTDKGIMHQVKQ